MTIPKKKIRLDIGEKEEVGVSVDKAVAGARSVDDKALESMGIRMDETMADSPDLSFADEGKVASKHMVKKGVKDAPKEMGTPYDPIREKKVPIRASLSDFNSDIEVPKADNRYGNIDEGLYNRLTFAEKKKKKVKAPKPQKAAKRGRADDALVYLDELFDNKDYTGEDIVRLSSSTKSIRDLSSNTHKKRIISLIILALLGAFVILFTVGAILQNGSGISIGINSGNRQTGLSLFDKADGKTGTTKLYAEGIKDLNDTTYADIYRNFLTIDGIDGSHNTENYFAYTFYVANTGAGAISYNFGINIISAAKGVSEAVRFMIIRDSSYDGLKENKRIPYVVAKPEEDGSIDELKDLHGNILEMQDNAEAFHSQSVPYLIEVSNLYGLKSTKPDRYRHKYTIVFYIEGGDKDCVNGLKGAQIKFNMEFTVTDYKLDA